MTRTLALETINQINQSVLLYGWIQTIRDHGQITFLDLRDRSGLVQVVLQQKPEGFTPESVIKVQGKVTKRTPQNINPNLPTGEVEIQAEKVELISQSATPPFDLYGDGREIEEGLRLKYRYLDLRRPRLQKILKTRHQTIKFIRDWLDQRGFIEIETSYLTKATPEGARDFIVPSRLQPGKFYALPQSPQQYKQLLMVAGFERYYQIVRCFRDEDPRADRAYGEFTQLDLELSFTTQEEVRGLIEKLFTELVESIFPEKHISQKPFPVLTYEQSMKQYNTDRPDLRRDKNDSNELAFGWIVDFPLFEWKESENRWDAVHHPFTAPKKEYLKGIKKKKGFEKAKANQYDFVLNGLEIGGGSIRITDPELQATIFEIMGHSREEVNKKFGHLLTAFKYGVPPHGGIAPGIDRFLMAALGEPSIREIIAFPATSSGQTSVMNAPSELPEEQLAELHLQVVPDKHSLWKKIGNLLSSRQVKYQEYEHQPVFTSEEAANVRGTELQQGAKALVVYLDNKPGLIVLSAATKVNPKAFKKAFGINDLRFASAEEVLQLTGVEIGAVPPFGTLVNLPTYLDEKLLENKEIVFNAGSHTRSIKMKAADYDKIESARTAAFSKPANEN